MKGTKRFASSDSAMEPFSAVPRKRVMEGSQIDSFERESQSALNPGLSLDMTRALSSRHHVRALNSQFASWVQLQLKEHPDELWEDGAKDYLTHARDIMEKFNDVVEWLKTNASGGSVDVDERPAKETSTGEKVFQANTEHNLSNNSTSSSSTRSLGFFSGNQTSDVPKTTQTSSVFSSSLNYAQMPSSPSFGLFSSQSTFSTSNSQVSGLFSYNQATGSLGGSENAGSFSATKSPFSFGTLGSGPLSNQTSVLFGQNQVKNDHISHDANDDDELPQPSSPSVKKSHEEGITVVHEVKCKLYVKSTDPADKDAWKDRGTGQLLVKCREGIGKGTKESKPTIIIRNDVGKILLNALLYPGIKTSAQRNSLVAVFHSADSVDGDCSKVVARTFLIRTKTVEERSKLEEIISEFAPIS